MAIRRTRLVRPYRRDHSTRRSDENRSTFTPHQRQPHSGRARGILRGFRVRPEGGDLRTTSILGALQYASARFIADGGRPSISQAVRRAAVDSSAASATDGSWRCDRVPLRNMSMSQNRHGDRGNFDRASFAAFSPTAPTAAVVAAVRERRQGPGVQVLRT